MVRQSMFDGAHYETQGILLPTPGDVGSCAICASEAFPSVEHTCNFFWHPCQKVKTKLISRGKNSYGKLKHVRWGSLRN